MVNLNVDGVLLKDVELVVLDRDGTLIDLYKYWSGMVRKRAELICKSFNLNNSDQDKLMQNMGIDLVNKRIKPQGPVGLKKREVVMQQAINYLESIGVNDSESVCEDNFKEVDKWSLNNLNSLIIPIPGALELFEELKKKSCKIAIATNDRKERAQLTMDFLGLANQIDFIVGVDSVGNGKPAPDMIDLIINSLVIDRAKTIIVGDAITDVEMGLNAKLKASIGVCTGLTPRSELEKKTKYVIDDISQIVVE